jgi:hypothetical protein
MFHVLYIVNLMRERAKKAKRRRLQNEVGALPCMIFKTL